jgi:hypothetical protein
VATTGFLSVATHVEEVQIATEEYWKRQGYRVSRIIPRANEIYVQRHLERESLYLEFVDYETTPETDLSFVIPCGSSDLGLHVAGSVAYELSLWFQRHTGTIESFVTFRSSAEVTLLTNHDDGRDVVVVLSECNGAHRRG